MHGFEDFWGPSNKEPNIIEDDLGRFRSQFFISSAFQLEVLGQDNCVLNAPKGQVALYEESLQAGLDLPLHPFVSNILDFYKILPTLIIVNSTQVLIIFIILCN